MYRANNLELRLISIYDAIFTSYVQSIITEWHYITTVFEAVIPSEQTAMASVVWSRRLLKNPRNHPLNSLGANV